MDQVSESCKNLSLTCTGMLELFPGDLSFPNLKLLKLLHGDKYMTFPDEFYERMKKLEVLAFDNLICPSLPKSFQFSPNLRSLCLHSCLIDDLSCIGNLTNLEILSFALCNIQKLPSTIGKLRKLKVLDLTGCIALRIDDGVLEGFVQLEELYVRVTDGRAIGFTDANCNALEERSKNLSALEIEFFNNKAQPKSVFFKNLERFRISMGCFLEGTRDEDRYLFINTLKLVANTNEVLESKINELFGKTEILDLQVDGMHDLQDVLMESLHPSQHLCLNTLRVLVVSNCKDLTYLFSLPIVRCLPMLERLSVSSCPLMEEVVHVESTGEEVISFLNLKFLLLDGLPELVGLCKTPTAIELPQLVELEINGLPYFRSIYPENSAATSVSGDISAIRPFLNKEVAVPKLQILRISYMENLKEIWPCQLLNKEDVNSCILRTMEVRNCNDLVNLFPTNLILLLHHLQELCVQDCGSIEVIFDLDLELIYCNSTYAGSSSTNLRQIKLEKLEKLREVWRMKGVVNNSHNIMHAFQALTSIMIDGCKSFRHVFKPMTANFDMGGLKFLYIEGSDDFGGKGKKMNEMAESCTTTITNTQHEIVVSAGVNNIEVAKASAFPSHLIHNFRHLENLNIRRYNEVDVLFEIESTSGNQQLLLFPHLKWLQLWYMKGMTHVWKCKWKKKLLLEGIPQQVYVVESFHNLTEIYMYECKSIKYLLSPFIAKLLFNLKEVKIWGCDGIEEIISSRDDNDDEMATSTSTSIPIEFFPRLDTLHLTVLPSLERIGGGLGGSGSESNEIITTTSIHNQIQEVHTFYFHHLTVLRLHKCDLLGHMFTCSTISKSLKQLKKLTIKSCGAMQVIVKEEFIEEDTTSSGVMVMTTTKDVVFPHLQSLKLIELPNLKGFFLGMNDFQWPLLDNVEINDCPQMTVFTSGHSSTPKLNYIRTSLGKHNLQGDLNFHPTIAFQETHFPSSEKTEQHRFPWSFSNLVEVKVKWKDSLIKVIPSKELQQLQKLEKLKVRGCKSLVEVFEIVDGTNSDTNETRSAVIFPKLTKMKLMHLYSLEYIWKSHKWTVLEFPNLTRVSIVRCDVLGHVFTLSMVGGLSHLQGLHITRCPKMEVIFKEGIDNAVEEAQTRVKGVVFPCLKSLKLEDLPNLKGFCLGNEAFTWPSLDTLEISNCPQITVFTNGQSVTPKLKVIDTDFGLCYAGEGPNSIIKTKLQEGFQFGKEGDEFNFDRCNIC